MPPVVSTLGLSEAVGTSSNGDLTTPAAETSLRSQTWKNILQQPVNSWRRRNGAEKFTKNTSSSTSHPDHNSPNSTTRSVPATPELRSGQYNTASSPRQPSSLQSDSLVSLTSASLFSRNSYPSVISTSTDATSVSGTFTACGITCLANGQFVKPYKRLKNNLMVYLAHDDIELPRDAVEQWETADLDRLKTDLSEVVMKVYRKGVERESRRRRGTQCLPSGHHEYDISFELRMSGRATPDAQHVAIGPSIWIICASTWACKEIRTAMDQITWPTLPVEIHEGRVPIPSVAEGEVDINKLDLTNGYRLGDGTTLYIHVEDLSTNPTSCGLLCCTTIKDGDTYSHRFSRIGGLVTTTNTLRSSQFGVSTAHGILDHPWWHRQLWTPSPAPEWECQSIESSDGEDEDELDSESLFDDQEGMYTDIRTPSAPSPNVAFSLNNSNPGEGYRDPGLVPLWRNVTHHGVLSFLGASMTTEKSLQHAVQLHEDTGNQTDHSMLRLEPSQDTSSRPWNNKYRPRGALLERSIDITTHIKNDKLTQGMVSIICQAHSPLDAHLLPGSTCLAMGGRMFKLRKLKTASPLARGVSGTWVARGSELCGMVIAVSDPEPYVYMMGAEDLISNLGASSPSIETIEVFNSRSRSAKHEADETLPRKWSSSKLPHRLATGIASPRASVDENRPITGIKRSLSRKIKSLGGISPSHEAVGNETPGDKCTKPRRTRSVRGLLSDMFRTKIEEIIQPEDRKGNDITQRKMVRRMSAASNHHTHNYYAQARKRYRPGKERRLCSLEPISEVSSVVTFGVDNIPELEHVFLQSTACVPAATFRHGPIRLHKLDLMPRQESTVTADRDSPEPKVAPSRTSYHCVSDNYESQQEAEFDEVGDLIDWWESWSIEDPGDPILDEPIPDEPLSPISTASDNFPGVSYSDTNSENSLSSCYADSAQGYFPKSSWECEHQDLKGASANILSGGSAAMPSLKVAEDLDGNGSFMGNPDGICEHNCIVV
ncbi:hypothetical protein F4859DRAFT_466896 [Xylaria cf. heliscus]|nr:hypothetical protein F4859DRAFT_466896 [Xylaria cf. heliscus]